MARRLTDKEVKRILSGDAFEEYVIHDYFIEEQDDGLYSVVFRDGMVSASDMTQKELDDYYEEYKDTREYLYGEK